MVGIKVLLCDDIEPILRRYAIYLASSEVEIVGQATSGAQAVELALRLRPDVVLMDMEMETREAGISATRKILAAAPEIRVIACTVYEDSELINKAFGAGCVDYLVKDMPIAFIRESIINAYLDQTVIRPRIVDALRDELTHLEQVNKSLLMSLNSFMLLTPSETALIGLMLKGKTRTDICEERAVELSTIKSQIHSILRKTDSKTMRELLDSITRLGLAHVFLNAHVPPAGPNE